jgi:phosphoribosyl-AMP cyclohydrolase
LDSGFRRNDAVKVEDVHGMTTASASFDLDKVNWAKGDGLIPAIAQDAATLRVLMLGYMNREALEKTLASGAVTFFSRSKQRLWQKGETFGEHDAKIKQTKGRTPRNRGKIKPLLLALTKHVFS